MDNVRLSESLVSPLKQYMYRITLHNILLSIKTNIHFVNHTYVLIPCESFTLSFTAYGKFVPVY